MIAKLPPCYAVASKQTGAIITESITTDKDEAEQYLHNPFFRDRYEVVELEIKVKPRKKK